MWWRARTILIKITSNEMAKPSDLKPLDLSVGFTPHTPSAPLSPSAPSALFIRHSHTSDRGCNCGSTGSYKHKVKLLRTALILVSGFAVVELGVGYWSHSLALQAESSHLLSDSAALALSLIAAWIAQWQTNRQNNFAQQQVEAIAGAINGLGLVAIAIWIAIEAVIRLQSPPPEILSLPMLVTAGIGLGIGSINLYLLHGSSHGDLNMRGALLHTLADLIGSIGVIAAAIAVWLMHWLWVDGVIGLFVSGLILVSAIPLIFQSVHLLLRNL